MKETILAAAIQMNSGEDKQSNLDTAIRLVEQAAARGAELIALPELFNCLGRFEAVVEAAEPIPGPPSDTMGSLGARLQITLCAGSICEQSSTAGKGYNTSLLFGPEGKLLARYRKIHLFDIDLPRQVTIQESRYIVPGDTVIASETPLGRLGQATCYDLRFPELFRRLADHAVEIMILPSAFTRPTGRDHWEILLRARAVENQAYLIAPNQCGYHTPELVSYGHSAIVDPWGRLLASAPEDSEEVILAELTHNQLEHVRTNLPALKHRRIGYE